MSHTLPRVVLADLDDFEREEYFKFLVDNNIQFAKHVTNVGEDKNGKMLTSESYVATIRLVHRDEDAELRERIRQEAAKQEQAEQLTKSGGSSASASHKAKRHNALARWGRRASRPPEEMARVVEALAGQKSLFDYSCYPFFSSLITLRDRLKPRRRHRAWLMRHIEHIYDERYVHDTYDLRSENIDSKTGEVSLTNSGKKRPPPEERYSNMFPVFVVDYMSKQYGLKTLVDQQCWDLLYNLHALRRESREIEIFARFLEEYYDPDDLLFFLYVRARVEEDIGMVFRNRWSELGLGKERAPAPILLTARECVAISRKVFGSESAPLFQGFMQTLDRHFVVGEDGTRSIDVTHFLHLALIQYHETRPAQEEEAIAKAERETMAEQQRAAAAGNGVVAGTEPLSVVVSTMSGEGQVLISSKEEQEELYKQAERDYEDQLRKLSQAKAIAEAQDQIDEERKVQEIEMEERVRRAVQARRVDADASELGPGGVLHAEEKIKEWTQDALKMNSSVSPKTSKSSPMGVTAQAAATALPGQQEQQQQKSGVSNSEINSFLENIKRDQMAIEALEERFHLGTGPGAAGVGSGGKKGAAALVSPHRATLLAELQQVLSKNEKQYMQLTMQAACGNLEIQVQDAIQEEVSNNLSDFVRETWKGLLNSQQLGNVQPVRIVPGAKSVGLVELEAGLSYLLHSADRNRGVIDPVLRTEMDSFCKAFMHSNKVRKEFEPLVALLASYAKQRLAGVK